MILDDLHKACWDLANFTRSTQDQELVLPLRFWDVYLARDLPRQQYITSKRIDTTASRFQPLENTTITSGQAYEMLHLPLQTSYSHIELSMVAHAAWVLAYYKHCTTPEIEFTSVNPASYGHLRDFQNMMSYIGEVVRVLVPIEEPLQIRELLSRLGNSSDGIIGKEHSATKAPG